MESWAAKRTQSLCVGRTATQDPLLSTLLPFPPHLDSSPPVSLSHMLPTERRTVPGQPAASEGLHLYPHLASPLPRCSLSHPFPSSTLLLELNDLTWTAHGGGAEGSGGDGGSGGKGLYPFPHLAFPLPLVP